MLTLPADASRVAKVIGIDPGTDTLGVATIAFDTQTGAILYTTARTFRGERLSRHSWAREIHGDRLGRLAALEDELLDFFRSERPVAVASEAPFLRKKFAQAFSALTQAVYAAYTALRRYDMWMELYMIEPTVAKTAVGALTKAPKGMTKQEFKQEVTKALMRMPHLNYQGIGSLDQLDEHSTDAIAVAYCRYQTLIGAA